VLGRWPPARHRRRQHRQPEPAPDLNQIPALSVDRVDGLTGGAFGHLRLDAVAGVVNFVMKHNFQGMQSTASSASPAQPEQ